MPTDLLSDNSATTSPRISFSYDLSQSDTVPIEHLLRSPSSSTSDFNFCVHETLDVHHASMADELFSDGKILPTPMKFKTESCKPSPSPSPVEMAAEEEVNVNVNVKRQNSRSIWGFKRSSSCGSGNVRSLCPIALLSRSNSTGSSTSSKQSSSKEGLNQKQNQNVQKPSGFQKPPLKKTGYGYGYGNRTNVATGNGIRVDPVLNLGFGSLFSGNGKNRNKK